VNREIAPFWLDRFQFNVEPTTTGLVNISIPIDTTSKHPIMDEIGNLMAKGARVSFQADLTPPVLDVSEDFQFIYFIGSADIALHRSRACLCVLSKRSIVVCSAISNVELVEYREIYGVNWYSFAFRMC
jgi:hypothetical protein